MTNSTSVETQNKPTRRQIIIWQVAQCFVLALFLLLVYQAEDRLVPLIGNGARTPSLIRTEEMLIAQQLPFLPGKMWKMFPLMVAIALCLLVFDRWRFYLLSVYGGMVTLLLIGDRIYFQFFTSLLSIQSFQASQQAWSVKSSILAELRLVDAAPFLALGLMSVFGFYFNRAMTPGMRKNLTCFFFDRFLGLIFFILAFSTGQNAFQIPLADEAERAVTTNSPDKELPDFVTSSVGYAQIFGVLNYHIKNCFEYFDAKSLPIDEAEHQLLQETLSISYYSNQTSSELEGVAKGKNVILISMEAFQHYVIDLKVDGQELTPNLNELQHHALSWDYIIDNIAKGGTSDAEFSALTGLLPDTRRITAMTMPTNPAPISLPELLSAIGYHTLSLHGYEPAFWNRSVNHPALGFKEMLFQSEFTYFQKGLGVPDDTFFLESVSKLKQRPQPFFAFMITLTSHHPYSLPISDQKLNLDMPRSTAYDYFQAVHYADAALGLFLKKLASENLLDQSLIVIYGDHVAPSNEANSQLVLRKTGIDPQTRRETRVPLIIYSRDLEQEFLIQKAKYQKVVGGLQDVFPTVLHLLGEKVPFGIYGTHLFQSEDTRPIIPYYKRATGFLTGGLLYFKGQPDPFHDDQGVLFNSEAAPENFDAHASFLEAYRVMATHRIIFEKKPNFRKDWAPTAP